MNDELRRRWQDWERLPYPASHYPPGSTAGQVAGVDLVLTDGDAAAIFHEFFETGKLPHGEDHLRSVLSDLDRVLAELSDPGRTYFSEAADLLRAIHARLAPDRGAGSMTGEVIRPASDDDVEALADVYLSSARHHARLDPEFYVIPDRAAVVGHLRETLDLDDAARGVRLVAQVGGEVVGSAEVELRSPSATSMLLQQVGAWVGLAVLEDRRGSGVGSRLIEAAEEWARQRGASLMMLDASAANVEARRFYERHGYRLRGVLMTKQLETDGSADPYAPLKDRGWRAIAEIDARLERGEIDEAGWHAAMADLVVPAYLAAHTPWEGSGKHGSAEDWQYARSHVAHSVDRDGSFLDVGCANGYLLECLPAWTPYRLDRYGLDIAPELVDLARRRLPDLVNRLFVGNALEWGPPHRFTYVRTGLEYVPHHRRRELVDRLLGWTDRLIVGPFTEEAHDRPTEHLLRSWGHRIAGRSERAHRAKPGMEYRVLWIDADE